VRSRFAITQATSHASNSSGRAVDLVAGLAAVLALQPRMGILPKRRIGSGPVDCANFVFDGQNLNYTPPVASVRTS
jgi:hypothetical protein